MANRDKELTERLHAGDVERADARARDTDDRIGCRMIFGALVVAVLIGLTIALWPAPAPRVDCAAIADGVMVRLASYQNHPPFDRQRAIAACEGKTR